jgi:uncharacterized protein
MTLNLMSVPNSPPDAILFQCLAGSRAYGTATSESDDDIRGIFAAPASAYLELERPSDQVSDDRNNIVYYSLRRVIELLSEANPNILELLYMPADCVRVDTPEMDLLLSKRDLFITKQCVDTHIGYALSQIKKAKGQNKWINNPKPEAPPKKEDYCHIIPTKGDSALPPARPILLSNIGWDLSMYHAARLEYARDMYRLYHYGESARGVFRGDVIVCESIPLEHELSHFAGLLSFNEQGWKQALIDHQNYWQWRRERNEARWRRQESGELDFDAKNMMHTVRLLLSGKSIVEHGKPIIRFEGTQLDLLMSIRSGKLSFAEINEIADSIREDCEQLKQSSDLPVLCDRDEANKLLAAITTQWEQRCK